MPFPLIAAIGAGVSLANSASQLITNRQNQRFSEKMYNQTQADNLKNWNLQNEYNLPQNQMTRLKAAGLNPNLVYGNGGATNGRCAYSKSTATEYRGIAPQIEGIPEILGQLFETKKKCSSKLIISGLKKSCMKSNFN